MDNELKEKGLLSLDGMYNSKFKISNFLIFRFSKYVIIQRFWYSKTIICSSDIPKYDKVHKSEHKNIISINIILYFIGHYAIITLILHITRMIIYTSFLTNQVVVFFV